MSGNAKRSTTRAKSDAPGARLPAVGPGFQPSGGKRRREAERLAGELSPRQREVLTLLLRGAVPKEIAATMDITLNTVNEHVKALHRHFAVESRGELLALFVPTFY